METPFSLIAPCADFKTSYRAYIDELADEERYPFPLDFDHTDFSAMLEKIEQFRLGIELPEGYVPSTTYWLVKEQCIVGVSNLRHRLNDNIRYAGGHIGLGIRPSWRRSGAGKALLNMTLLRAKAMGIGPIHIHCYADNRPSMALIKACGGVLDSSEDLDNGHQLLRYLVHQPA